MENCPEFAIEAIIEDVGRDPAPDGLGHTARSDDRAVGILRVVLCPVRSPRSEPGEHGRPRGPAEAGVAGMRGLRERSGPGGRQFPCPP